VGTRVITIPILSSINHLEKEETYNSVTSSNTISTTLVNNARNFPVLQNVYLLT
jgi:hypothetical protein